MQEQAIVMNQLNDFLERRGLRANFLAQQVGISEASLYGFKSGYKLLTQRQLQKLRDFIQEYDQKMEGATVLSSLGIALRDGNGDFRSFAEVIDEVRAKWEQFSSTDKQAVANVFADIR